MTQKVRREVRFYRLLGERTARRESNTVSLQGYGSSGPGRVCADQSVGRFNRITSPPARWAFWPRLHNLTSQTGQTGPVPSVRAVTGMGVRRYGVVLLGALLIFCGPSGDHGWAQKL